MVTFLPNMASGATTGAGWTDRDAKAIETTVCHQSMR